MTNTWKEDLDWYRHNQTTSQIGFNPNGMCLKVCRTSRGIGPRFLTAKQAQDATPREHRVQRVRDLRRGMKLFFDDPNDSNTAGHIVTMIGRVKNFDWDSLDDIIVETNSVVSGELVRVRASYFGEHWGDSFQFGTDYLNGVEFDFLGKEKSKPKPKPEPRETPRIDRFREQGNAWNINILDRAAAAGRKDIGRIVKDIEEAVADLPDDIQESRVKEFKETFKKERFLRMALLNEAVKDGRMSRVKAQRDRLRSLIKSVLRS